MAAAVNSVHGKSTLFRVTFDDLMSSNWSPKI